MHGQGLYSSWLIHWIERETERLDFVASWETLVGVYRQMEFIDEINDTVRISEFKSIVSDMNKFLGKARAAMSSCEDWADVMDWLNAHMDGGDASDRKGLAYQKLRQAWVMNARSSLMAMVEAMETEEREDEDER